MLSEVCHPGHVQNASQGLPGLFSFNWVDQWMMTQLNGFNLGGSSQIPSTVSTPAPSSICLKPRPSLSLLPVSSPRAVACRSHGCRGRRNRLPFPMPKDTKVEPPHPPLFPHALGFENGGRSCRRLELEQPSHGGLNRQAQAAQSVYSFLRTHI